MRQPKFQLFDWVSHRVLGREVLKLSSRGSAAGEAGSRAARQGFKRWGWARVLCVLAKYGFEVGLEGGEEGGDLRVFDDVVGDEGG